MNAVALLVAILAAIVGAALAAWSLRRERRISQKLRDSRERYMLVAEGANDGIWDWDIPAQRIFFSPRLHRMLGYAEGELRDPADLKRIVLDEDYPAARAALNEHMQHQRNDELRRVMRMRTRDGRVLTVLARSVTRYAPDGSPVRVAGSYTDITGQLANERQLRLAASAFETGRDGIVIGDARNRVASVNRAFLAMTGYAREELLGMPLRDLMADDPVRLRAEDEVLGNGAWSGELGWHKRNGETKVLDTTITLVRESVGDAAFRLCVCTDSAELRYAQARIRHLAYFDPLTGLPNRSHLATQFSALLATAEREQRTLAVVFFDLDNFKEINDTAGHSIGDEVICVVAQRLGEGIRENDVLCRFGGDEFLIVLADADPHAADALARRLMAHACKAVEVAGRVLPVSASAGYAMYPDDARDAENLVRLADTALYRAKDDGGNSVQRFQSWMGEALVWRHELQNALRLAIDESQFTLRYQPVVDMREQRVIGCEALLYWDRPGMGVVGPNSFIGLAEESRLIEPIGEWVVREVCRQIAAWRREGMPRLHVAVNVSSLQLRVGARFGELLSDAMRHHGIGPDDLVLEITERHLVQDVNGGVPVIETLAASGVRVSVDDFGTGYSNLGALKDLTVAQIKIDRSFVRNLDTEVGDRAIVQSIVALGRSLGLEVVAEGVETEEQETWLLQFGCHIAQGYRYARPMPAAELPAFVQARSLPRRSPASGAEA